MTWYTTGPSLEPIMNMLHDKKMLILFGVVVAFQVILVACCFLHKSKSTPSEYDRQTHQD